MIRLIEKNYTSQIYFQVNNNYISIGWVQFLFVIKRELAEREMLVEQCQEKVQLAFAVAN